MTVGPAEIPAQQPYLHDLAITVKAPAFAVAAADGSLPGRGAAGVFLNDLRVLSTSEIALSGAVLAPVVTDLEGAGATHSVLVARGLGDGHADPTVWVEWRRVLVGADDGYGSAPFEDGTVFVAPGTVVREIVEIRSTARQAVHSALTWTLGCDFAGIAEVKSGQSPVAAASAAAVAPSGVAAVAAVAESGRLRWTLLGGSDGDTVVTASADPETADVAASGSGSGSGASSGSGSVSSSGGLGRLTWPVYLEPGGVARFCVDVSVKDTQPVAVLATGGESALGDLRVESGDIRIPRFVERSLADLRGLELRDPSAPDDHFLAAGAPWFLTLFGRDSLIAAHMLLPLGTRLAAGTLRTLARRQGTKTDPETAEQPGKILHEIRRAPSDHASFGGPGHRLGLPPLYYGTVDATPLWITLLHEAWRWGMPADEVSELLPALTAALAWMRDYGLDEAGFLSYHDESGHGLTNQGWKDSFDSIQFADGRLAAAPLALSEVQGYAYQAAMSGAALLDAFGLAGGSEYRAWAAALAARFRERFWTSDASGASGASDASDASDASGRFPAVALDRDAAPVNSVASNMGHLLGTGLLNREESALIAARLRSPELSSGYGLRTMATSAAGFSPLSYHGGSVWTHDTALAIRGLARAASEGVPGAARSARRLMHGLLEAAAGFDYRMPELFAGTRARPGGRPMPYPASCRPQAWAAATSVALVTAMLGVDPDVPGGSLAFRPLGGWEGLTVRGLRVGAEAMDVRLGGHGEVEVLES